MVTPKLNTLQLELLKIYSMQPTDEDMVAIKKILADYFSDKIKTKVQQAIDERGITENDLEKWINE